MIQRTRPEPVGADVALDLLRKAVDDRGPDFVYPDEWRAMTSDCLYFQDGGAPACIVGYVLDQLGVGPDDLESDLFAADELNEYQSKVRFTSDALVALNAAQRRQDQGDPWEAALRSAEAVTS